MFYKKVCVMLDNGHGVDTKGKRSPDSKLLEYKYAREIVGMIKEQLEELDILVYLVTPEEKDVSLQTRVNRANAKYIECKASNTPTLFISVHVNASGNGNWMNARGWSAYTSKGQSAGDKLASCLYKEAHFYFDKENIKIREDWTDKDADLEEDFYVVKKTYSPAVLTENFFMDNKEDVKYLLSKEGKETIANIHVDGILNYIDEYC